MKLYSIIKKVYHIISSRYIYHRNFIYPNLYLFNVEQTKLKNIKTILFFFDNPEYMHLGDHIFFLPLIKTFMNSGYNITVNPTKAMYDVFVGLNIPTVNAENCKFNQYDLIISRFELIRHLKKYRSLLIHVSKNLSLPISEQMIYELNKHFNLVHYNAFNFNTLTNHNILSKFSLPTNKKLVFFNLYCDASNYLITTKKCNLLLNFVKEYANNSQYAVVLVGSKADKNNDRRIYDFAHIDLRGKTTVLEIFNLVAQDNTTYYVGFDSFLMHVFSLYEKHSFVLFRGRITKKQNEMLKKYHTTLFSHDNFVQLLN